jgi:hypothetical protein
MLGHTPELREHTRIAGIGVTRIDTEDTTIDWVWYVWMHRNPGAYENGE